MNVTMLGFLGGSEMVVILIVAAVFFGAKKLPELARGLGQGIREFKKVSSDVTDDLERAVYAEPPPPPQKAAKSPSADADILVESTASNPEATPAVPPPAEHGVDAAPPLPAKGSAENQGRATGQ